MRGSEWTAWTALALSLVALALHHHAIARDFVVDDAFITFRYARNLAEGFGPIYNPGGEHVEGYTNFAWMLLLAGGWRVGLEPLALAKVLGAACGVLTLLLVSRAHRFAPGLRPAVSAVATLAVGTHAVFAAWITSGMETSLFTLLVTLCVLLHLRALESRQRADLALALGLSCAALSLTRPDGVLVAGLVLLHRRLASGRAPDRGFRLALAVFLAVLLPYFAWRVSYYGYLLPNTFYAKVDAKSAQVLRGLRYAGGFAWISLHLLALGLLAVLLPGAWLRARPRALVLPAAVAGVALYVVAVGGDAMPAYRFFAPIVPLLALLAAAGLVGAARRPTSLAAGALLLVAINTAHALTHREVFTRVRQGDPVAIFGREVGLWLKEHARPDAVLATNTAGTIPYYSNLTTIDMLGLNDVHIAHVEIEPMGGGLAGHEKGDGRYVLSRRPDIIQFRSMLGGGRPGFLGDYQIAALPEFRRDYVYRVYRLPSGRFLKLYERREASAPVTPGAR